VEANRNFANKIWNVGRFVINAIDSLPRAERSDERSSTLAPAPSAAGSEVEAWTLADSWIWARLQQLVRDVERLFQTFQYGEAGRQIYEFLWSDFADWYVEVAKGQLQAEETRARTVETLARVFDTALRLLHPFTPFVTEELWDHLRSAVSQSPISSLSPDWPDALIIAPWPSLHTPEGWEESKIADFEQVQEIVRSIRNLRAEKVVSPSKRIAATIAAGAKAELLKEQSKVIASLAGLNESELRIVPSLTDKPGDAVALVVGTIEVYLPLAGMVDLSEEKARLEKELREAESHIQRLEKLLAGDFANKAPAHLVTKERDKLAGYKETAEKIQAQLK
jgi:valyl-tRNA synthetase